MAIDIPGPPLNEKSVVIEWCYHNELIRDAYGADSMAEVFAKEVSNLRPSERTKPVSNRMAKFKVAGLIGSFNDTGVNSRNYKKILVQEHA